MKTERYNGWKNHATWCVNLHLSNTESWVNDVFRMAKETIADAPKQPQVKDGIWKTADAERYMLADAVKRYASGILTEFVEADPKRTAATLFAWDMVSGYLSEVDWDEIARAAIESVCA